jgi:hypothetical protein
VPEAEGQSMIADFVKFAGFADDIQEEEETGESAA